MGEPMQPQRPHDHRQETEQVSVPAGDGEALPVGDVSGLEAEARAVGGRTVTEPCQEAIATLYSFLDGELTAKVRRRIQDHLDDCAPCLSKFDFEAELKALVGRKCRDEVPDSLKSRVAMALKLAGDVPS